jgi:hypothetical protein
MCAKTSGTPWKQSRTASQDCFVQLTDSHRKRDVTSLRYRFPTLRAASAPRRFRFFSISAISSMISVGRSSRGNTARFCYRRFGRE